MRALILAFFLTCTPIFLFSQEDTTSIASKELVRVIQTDKTELIGRILKQDEREITFETADGRKIIIPQYVVKEIIPIKKNDFNAKGVFIGEDMFATRYFITTNGLPIKKGEHYVQWNLFGPDFQFALSDRFGVGVMTSWFATPLIASAKYSFEINDKNHFAVGALIGTSSWAAFSGLNIGGALPFATYSHGSRKANIALTGGYGAVWFDGFTGGRGLTSIAGMVKVGQKISLVFDSFIVLPGAARDQTSINWVYDPNTGNSVPVTTTIQVRNPGFALLIPGIRWHLEEGRAFQFGFAGALTNGNVFPLPIPMLQWYRRIN